MKDIALGLPLLLCAAAAPINATTIVSVTGPADGQQTVLLAQIIGSSWSQTANYVDVNIVAQTGGDCGLSGRGPCGAMYLTNAIGPSATPSNVIASTSLQTFRSSGLNTIFTGLTLPANTYYLLLFNGSTETEPYWATSSAPILATDTGVSPTGSFITASGGSDYLFPPGSAVTSLNANLEYTVTGTPAAIPEPSSRGLAIAGLLVLLQLMSFRVFVRAQ